jgi:hypothetical protein
LKSGKLGPLTPKNIKVDKFGLLLQTTIQLQPFTFILHTIAKGGDKKRKDKFHSPIKVLDQMELSRGQVTNALNLEVATFT